MLWSNRVPGNVFYTCGWIIHIHTYIIPTFLLLEPVIIIYHDYYHLSWFIVLVPYRFCSNGSPTTLSILLWSYLMLSDTHKSFRHSCYNQLSSFIIISIITIPITMYSSWWFQPIWKFISQIGSLLQIGVNIKNLWNHHLVIVLAS